MKEFYDTSVLVAAFWGGHKNHKASLDLVSAAHKNQSACAMHSLAEVYATMTALPVRPPVQAEHAMLFLQEIRERMTLISLNEAEYFETIRKVAEQGFTSGRVYDALLLRCAVAAKASVIYTWNVKHFLETAPDLANRIRTP